MEAPVDLFRRAEYHACEGRFRISGYGSLNWEAVKKQQGLLHMHLNQSRCAASSAFLLAIGAFLAAPYTVASAKSLTYSDDAAPIFFEHCASCHRPGQIAPMSLLSYDEARPWAKSIAKAVRSGKMPPWSGESDRHEWSNDISLSETQIETIVGWVEQGAREGNPADLPDLPTFSDGWQLGEPDYVIKLSKIEVPADGEDLFPKETVTLDIDESRWVRAIEYMPGDRRVAHHSMLTYSGGGATKGAKQGILAIWTAGMPPFEFPEGMGRVLPAKTRVLIDSHYHPYGEATTDETRVGLYFGEGELKKEVATMIASNTGLRIPPGSPHHEELAFQIFDRDMQILAFSPHLHLRGKSMRYDLTYPDGRKETLLNVPKFNFNWQWQYYPTEAIDVPAGSRLDVIAVWDNSSDNPANPDPSQEIIFRGNTFNEMFVGFFEAIEKNGVYHRPPPAKEKILAMLSEHDAEDTYFVGGFLPFGMYVPKQGEGWLYLVQGSVTFTISLDDIEWDGNRLYIETQLPTPEASATTTIIEGELDETGRLKGTLRYGVDSDRPLNLPMIAQPLPMIDSDSATAGAR